MSQFDKDNEGRVGKAGFVDEPTPSIEPTPTPTVSATAMRSQR
jgi:hypothetical protein